MEGEVGKWCSFERMFYNRSFFSGEHQLDPALLSLIHLDESVEPQRLPDGRWILFDENRLRLRMRSASREMKRKYSSCKKRENFSPLEFVIQNDIPLDKITGVFPMVFDNYRLVSHSLRMAWAFYLTLRMKKMDKMNIRQRIRGGRFSLHSKNLLTVLFIHIHSNLSKLENSEKKWIKCLKNSLCYHVSESMDQDERPEGDRFNLVPVLLRPIFNQLKYDEKVNFFFSLLQSKVLCKEVPEDFILDTLIDHREKLTSKSKPLSDETRSVLYQRGLDFGKLVKKFYHYDKGFLPSNKATFAFPRDRGGQKGDLVYNDRLKNERFNPRDRMEPFVIGLFGQPGQGKSSQLSLIISKLESLFPGCPRDQLIYSRSCHTEHWDGYKNQPIVVLDDIGQSREGKDIKEFQTLVSCNPYVPPMAALEDKGILFSSPIIILTSNLLYGLPLQYCYQDSCGIIDDASFWRRIHVPLYVENKITYRLKEAPLWIREKNLMFRGGTSYNSDVRINSCSKFFQSEVVFKRPKSHKPSEHLNELYVPIEKGFYSLLKNQFRTRQRFHDNIRQTWIQTVTSKIEDPSSLTSKDFYSDQIEPFLPSSLGFDGSPELRSTVNTLEFNAFPPDGPLPVRVEPIVEPLKVRTITAGIGETFCLKPFQRAMWHALGLEEQFCLTHGTNNLESAISRIWDQSQSGDHWISGDYTAATDSFPIEATKCLLEGILESIEHEPTKRWAMKEISPHILVYPPSSGLEPALQESGQLMGSLLSFPLLCLLNDCTAKSIGLSSSQYLINGDDILMRTQPSNYPLWKEKVEEFGLSLSLGKNYIHPYFGTVNSQLIREGTVTESGKQKVVDRRARVLGECLRDLEVMMKEHNPDEVQDLFKAVNRSKLSQTVRSIRVPVSHGGLSFSWGDRTRLSDLDKRTEILVYLNDLFKKITPDKDCLAIPYLSKTEFRNDSVESEDRCFNEPVVSSEYHEDFIGIPQLQAVKKRLMTHPSLRNIFVGQDIESLPPLCFLKVLQVPFKDVRVRKKVQIEIDKTFFLNFLDRNTDYDYELFRKTFLEAVRGVQGEATEVATQYLAPIIELDVKPDYLLLIDNSYKVENFDSQLFEKSLGKALEPKQFNLPSLPDCPDFSKEVEDSFNLLLKSLAGEDDLDELIECDPGFPVNLLDFED